jgi:hypothetical protein
MSFSLKVDSGSNVSIKRISRLSPNLQQFSCTFVKPMKAPTSGLLRQFPHKALHFQPSAAKTAQN